MGRRRVVVLGLDCAEPSLVFERFAHRLPTLTALRHAGVAGRLHSTVPPITVPAWACMVTGYSPGTLGIYGFRDRASHRYGDARLVTSADLSRPTLWQRLGDAGEPVVVAGVPPSYPPYPVRGALVSCLLTPSTEVDFTYPHELKQQILNEHPDYRVDLEDVRGGEPERLQSELGLMVDQHFDVFAALLREQDWTFAMMVEMALDRAHHAFWHHTFSDHPLFVVDSPYASTLVELYAHLDRRIDQLLTLVADDRTTILVVSDHGAQALMGGYCLNEWLVRRGHLGCFHRPEGIATLAQCRVDWSRTNAWGEGGYCGRIHLNVQGREPHGQLTPDEVPDFLARLEDELLALTDEQGRPLDTVVYRPEQIYPQLEGIAPDLIVYFDNLAWRCIGTLGHGRLCVPQSDQGPDGANHTAEGLWIASGAGVRPRSALHAASILDVAPTILHCLGQPIPADMEGTPIEL